MTPEVSRPKTGSRGLDEETLWRKKSGSFWQPEWPFYQLPEQWHLSWAV